VSFLLGASLILNVNKNIKYYILGSLIVVFLTVFNPLFMNYLMKVIPIFVFDRYFLFIPIILIIASLIDCFISQRNNILKSKIIVFFIVLAFIFNPFRTFHTSINNDYLIFYDFFNKNIRDNALVLSDPKTSYRLASIKAIKIYAAEKTFIKANLENEVIETSRKIFSSNTSSSDRLQLIGNINPDYIIINKDMMREKKVVDDFDFPPDNYSVIYNSRTHKVLKSINL
jgi:hypothetical protein